MSDIFISYSREDQAFARRFANGFEREGLSVWWDQSLSPGEAFDQVTERALEEASAVIVLWSKSSVSSRWVRSEATQANANQRLVPVTIEPCKRPIMFELTHTADLSDWQGNVDDPAWQSFVASVRQFVQRADMEAGPLAPVNIPLRPAAEKRKRGPGAATQISVALSRFLRGRLALAIAFALLGAAIAGGLALLRKPPQGDHEVTRFTVDLAEPMQSGEPPALAPDGRRIVYAIGRQLYSRRLDQDEATPIPGATDAQNPFFSPDGKSVAFFTPTQLKAFEFGGEASRVIADVKPAAGLVGTWDQEGRIFFGQGGVFGLSTVPAFGGVPESFAELKDYGDLDYPDVLPGGKWVLFTANIAGSNWSSADIVAQNVATGERKVVLKGGHFARYLPTGHLVFARGGTIYAVAFDAQRLELRGRPVPVVQSVMTNEQSGHAMFAVSANGTLIYTPGSPGGAGVVPTNVARVNRAGESAALSTDPRDYSSPRVSPDGSRIAVEVLSADKSVHIWIMEASGAATQLTFEGENRYPVWTSDGREVLFRSKRGTEYSIYRKAADGTDDARRVLGGTADLVPTDVRGHTLVFQERGKDGPRDILTLDLEKGGPPQPLLATSADESSARVSPDGAWIAYVSMTVGAGVPEPRIYARPFPNTAAGGQRSLSESPGVGPTWSRTGDEIFIIEFRGVPGALISVPIAMTSTTITPGGRRELFLFDLRFDVTLADTSYAQAYDVLPDGRFVMVEATPPKPQDGADSPANRPHFNVVMNWFEDLRRLVPAE